MTGPALPIDPVRRSTLGSVVTDRLRDLIISGSFEPGALLSEVDLASRFGVSRGPIREALQRLLQEGLLRREPRRGISIPVIDDDDIADLYFAREAIESAAMKLVIGSDIDPIVARLREIVDELRDAAGAEDWAVVADLDMAFHSVVVEAARSPRLSRIYASIIDETKACFSMTARYPGREDLVAEHEQLLALLERRDTLGVLAALASHLSQSIRTLAVHRAAGRTERIDQTAPAEQDTRPHRRVTRRFTTAEATRR